MESSQDRHEGWVVTSAGVRVTRVLTFRGPRESEILGAGAGWLAEHRQGVIVSLSWHGDVADGGASPMWQMEMVVEGTA